MPSEMFAAASQLNLAGGLSRMLRLAGFEKAMMVGPSPTLFMNTHPAETASFALNESLKRLRDVSRDQPLALEIPEPVAEEVTSIQQWRATLSKLDIDLAYDHFGSGQSRRVELAAIRPDFVKFDTNLIRDIHLDLAPQQALLASLVQMARDLDIVTLAMGVECESEHTVCCEIGFELAQGFFYGQPASKTVIGNPDAGN